jgi:hypothetical protein
MHAYKSRTAEQMFIKFDIGEFDKKKNSSHSNFHLDWTVSVTTSHEFLHAWAAISMLYTCAHCINACSVCALSTMLDYNAVFWGMVKRQSIWAPGFHFWPTKCWV